MFRERNQEFETLALPLLEPLYNFAYWQAHNREEAQDLVQETFVKAMRGFSSFERGTNFKAWMFRILRNTFLTSRTGLKAMPMADVDDPAIEPALVDSRPDPESLLLQTSDRDALQRALEQLPAQSREVILLCDLEEMKYQEIADLLQVPIGTVMSRLARARSKMRQLLVGEAEKKRK